MDRRNFLKNVSLLSAGMMTALNANANVKTVNVNTNKGLGLQMYTLGPELTNGNLAENLRKIRSFGIKNVELAGYDANSRKVAGVSVDDFKKMADDADLKIVSSHTGLNFSGGMRPGQAAPSSRKSFAEMKDELLESMKPMAEDHAKMGCQYLIQAALMGVNNEETALYYAELMNEGGALLKSISGLQYGYHNHNFEFAIVTPGSQQAIMGDIFSRPRNGKMIEDIFMDNTDPSNVIFEMDVYWAVMGQQDPVEWLTKRADRIHMLHIKDRLVVGQSGMLNFKNIFNKFYANGRKYFFIEIEDTNSGKQFERLEQSANFLNESDFVK